LRHEIIERLDPDVVRLEGEHSRGLAGRDSLKLRDDQFDDEPATRFEVSSRIGEH
jgi:hypothetical protein